MRWVVGLLLMIALPISAVVVTNDIVSSQIRVGDVVTMNLRLRFDQPPADLEMVPVPEKLSESLSVRSQGPLIQESTRLYRWPMRVQILGVGDVVIPTLTVQMGVSGRPVSAGLPSGRVSVQSVLSQADDPDQLKSGALQMVSARLVWYWRLAWLWGLLGLGAFVGIVYWYRSRRQRSEDSLVEKTPLELAQAQLRRLSKQTVSGHDAEVQFGFKLTEIVKQYYGAFYRVSLLDTTTVECLGLLKPRMMPRVYGALVLFLNHCDAIKFARGGLTQKERGDLLSRATSLVEGVQ